MSTNGNRNAKPLLRGIFDRLPPQHLEAERGLLASLMLVPGSLDEVIPTLQREDFYRDSHQEVFAAITYLYAAGVKPDGLAVCDRLKSTGKFDSIGGHDGLSGILETVIHAANIKYFSDIVREKATMRAALEAANTMIADIYSNDYHSKQVLQRAEKQLFQLASRTTTGNLRSIGEILPEVMDAIERRKQGEITGLESGFPDLDLLTGGFQPGQLVILGARPSHGKSALAWSIVEHAAVELRLPALFASLEMSAGSLVERALSSRGEVDGLKIRTGWSLLPKDLESLSAARETLQAAPIWIDDTPSQSMLQALSTARRVKLRAGLAVYVFDYAQLAAPDDPRESRQEQVAAISRRLKAMARELEIPVIGLSQLNRQVETRPDHQPVLADLRESGGLEQDADIVILLHRPERYDPNDQPGIAIADVAKNRNGATGTAKLVFRKHITKFESLSNHSPF